VRARLCLTLVPLGCPSPVAHSAPTCLPLPRAVLPPWPTLPPRAAPAPCCPSPVAHSAPTCCPCPGRAFPRSAPCCPHAAHPPCCSDWHPISMPQSGASSRTPNQAAHLNAPIRRLILAPNQAAHLNAPIRRLILAPQSGSPSMPQSGALSWHPNQAARLDAPIRRLTRHPNQAAHLNAPIRRLILAPHLAALSILRAVAPVAAAGDLTVDGLELSLLKPSRSRRQCSLCPCLRGRPRTGRAFLPFIPHDALCCAACSGPEPLGHAHAPLRPHVSMWPCTFDYALLLCSTVSLTEGTGSLAVQCPSALCCSVLCSKMCPRHGVQGRS